jgi:hypothetical protein
MPRPWIRADDESGATIMLAAGAAAGHLTIEAHDPADSSLVRLTAPAQELIDAACGLSGTPVPVILRRRRIPRSGTCRTPAGTLAIDPETGRVTFTPSPGSADLTPRTARETASAFASIADAAEQHPGPQQVRDLAEVISAQIAAGGSPEDIALAILSGSVPVPRMAAEPAS